MLQEQAVPERTLGLLKELSPQLAEHGFYLAGGTALALRLGHRLSIDLDFFSAEPFGPEALLKIIEGIADTTPSVLAQTKGSLSLVIDETKVEFLHYEHPLLN